MNLIHTIISKNYDAMNSFIFHHHSEFNITDEFGNTPLLFAIALEDMHSINFLIDRGADINLPNQGGITPLICALMKKNDHITKLLIDNGANADQIKDLPIDTTKALEWFAQNELFENYLTNIALSLDDVIENSNKIIIPDSFKNSNNFINLSEDEIAKLSEQETPKISKILKRVTFADDITNDDITSAESKSDSDNEMFYKKQKISFDEISCNTSEDFANDDLLLGLDNNYDEIAF